MSETAEISILLPYYWWKGLPELFEPFGFRIYWPDNPEVSQRKIEAENFIAENEPDLAIEWQWCDNDFPIRDLLKKYGRNTPVILALNWNGSIQDNPNKIGFAACLNTPFRIREMLRVFSQVLPEKRNHLFRIK